MVTTTSARVLFLCALVLLGPVVEARRVGGGGGGIGRGSSGGRAQVGGRGSGGIHPSGHANIGHHNGPVVGGNNFHPAPGGNNFHRASGGTTFHLTLGGSRSGSGSGPSGARSSHSRNGVGSVKRTSHLKAALVASAAGAVGGIVTYEAGKAIIRSATEPFHYGSRSYYFDNYHQRVPNDRFVCHMPVNDLAKPDLDNFFSTLQFRNGSRPKTLVWTCDSDLEVCCGTDCCVAPSSSSSSSESLLSLIAFVILTGLVVVVLLVRCCKRRCKCCSSDADMSDGDNHDNQDANKYANDYPSDSYGQQQQYPSYPPPSNAYPPNLDAHSSYPINSH